MNIQYISIISYFLEKIKIESCVLSVRHTAFFNRKINTKLGRTNPPNLHFKNPIKSVVNSFLSGWGYGANKVPPLYIKK